MTKQKWDPDAFAAFIGIDWADKKHDVCLRVSGSDELERLVLPHKVAAIDEWATKVGERFGRRPVAVCIELAHGPIVSALLKHEFLVIFPLDPSKLAGHRKMMRPSGAKDDANDAELAMDYMARYPDKIAPLRRQSVEMRTLELLVASRRDLVDDTTRVTNRVTYALKAYFPQVLDWFRDKDTLVFCHLLQRWPTLAAIQAEDDDTVVAFFKQHNLHRRAVIDRRIQAIRSESTLTDDPAVVEPNQLLVSSYLVQLIGLIRAVEDFDVRIAEVMQRLPDAGLFRSLPAAGQVLAPRLLVAFGEDRDRFANAAAVQRAAGVAPVTEASGNQRWVHWRWACSKFLRQSFVEWAALTIPRSFWAGAYYRSMKERGVTHNAAIRALAFKWIRILYRMWVDRRPYDESTHLKTLQRRGSPLLKFAAQPAVSP